MRLGSSGTPHLPEDAVGSSSSYVALALAAAVVYTGLNALTTADRALLAEDVPDARRPAVNSAQELAAVAGGAMAVSIGGALLTPAPAAAFVLAAALLAAFPHPSAGGGRPLRPRPVLRSVTCPSQRNARADRAGSAARRAS